MNYVRIEHILLIVRQHSLSQIINESLSKKEGQYMKPNIINASKTRIINLDGTTNFRDLGGYIGHQDKTVKYNQFFRSDALHKLSDNDIAWLEEMGVKTIVDFRSASEIVDNEDKPIKSATYYNLNPKAEVAQTASA